MKMTVNFPECKTIEYILNTSSGYYEKQPNRIVFNKLPNELKVEQTREKKIRQNGANEVIHGRIRGGKYLFFTGLIPTGINNLFRGDHVEFIRGEKKKSLVLFEFLDNDRLLKVYFFNHYQIYKGRLEEFIQTFPNTLKKGGS